MKHPEMLPRSAAASDHTKMLYAISRLPEAQRIILALYYHEELSLEQIAQVLERPEDEVAADFYLGHVEAGVRVDIPEPAHAVA